MNVNIWVVGTLSLLFIRGSYIELNFQKNKGISGKLRYL